MQIGEKIKRIRTTFNLTQEELGQDLHLTRQTISNWEKGKSYPSIQDIVTISDHYKISLDELLKEDQEMLAHFETVDRQSTRQRYLYALAYCVSLVCLAMGIVSRYYLFPSKVTTTGALLLLLSVIMLCLTVQKPAVLYKNKWAILCLVIAFIYFVSQLTAVSGNTSYSLGMLMGDGLSLFIKMSAVYFIPQVPELFLAKSK